MSRRGDVTAGLGERGDITQSSRCGLRLSVLLLLQLMLEVVVCKTGGERTRSDCACTPGVDATVDDGRRWTTGTPCKFFDCCCNCCDCCDTAVDATAVGDVIACCCCNVCIGGVCMKY